MKNITYLLFLHMPMMFHFSVWNRKHATLQPIPKERKLPFLAPDNKFLDRKGKLFESEPFMDSWKNAVLKTKRIRQGKTYYNNFAGNLLILIKSSCVFLYRCCHDVTYLKKVSKSLSSTDLLVFWVIVLLCLMSYIWAFVNCLGSKPEGNYINLLCK